MHENVAEELFKEIITKNFLKLEKDISTKEALPTLG